MKHLLTAIILVFTLTAAYAYSADRLTVFGVTLNEPAEVEPFKSKETDRLGRIWTEYTRFIPAQKAEAFSMYYVMLTPMTDTAVSLLAAEKYPSLNECTEDKLTLLASLKMKYEGEDMEQTLIKKFVHLNDIKAEGFDINLSCRSIRGEMYLLLNYSTENAQTLMAQEEEELKQQKLSKGAF